MTEQQRTTRLNVDDLAKEKLAEIEKSLTTGSNGNLSLNSFTTCFPILKQIITAADLHRTNDDKNKRSQKDDQDGKAETGDSIYADYCDDNEQFTTQVDLSEQFANNSVKWTIRVKAFKMIHLLMQRVLGIHNDDNILAANPSKKQPKALIIHLPDLVRLSFVAATSPYDELKIQGFEMFRVLIERFSSYEEAEFPGHSILEQYKTQFLSAVKPAFNLDSPPYITAIACQICSLWICHGLEKSPGDVKRTYQLMLMSIQKLESQSLNHHNKLYTESELEQERLDILGAWANLYISSRESDLSHQHGKISSLSRSESHNLNSLIESQIEPLIDKWWEALKEYALLIMPSPKFIGLSHDNEDVYTREVALKLFNPTWPKLVLALTLWLCIREDNNYTENDSSEQTTITPDPEIICSKTSSKRASKEKYCKFLCGIIMKELCRCIVNKQIPNSIPQSTILSLRSLLILASNNLSRVVFADNPTMSNEFYRTLYSITVFNARDLNRGLLRKTLDYLFELIVLKIAMDKEKVQYGVASLTTSIIISLRDMKIASLEKVSNDIDVRKTHLSIRLKNLITLVKFAPSYGTSELPLQLALVSVFQQLLHYDEEPTYSLTAAENLLDLLPSIEEEFKLHILNQLFPELCTRVEKILASLNQCDTYCEMDKLNLSHLDNLLICMRKMIGELNESSRRSKIESYVKSSLAAFEKCDKRLESWISSGFKRKRDLLDSMINHNALLRTNHLHELTPTANEILDDSIKFQEKIRTSLVTLNQKDRSASKTVPSKSRVAKIALKADFSNFYVKKVELEERELGESKKS